MKKLSKLSKRQIFNLEKRGFVVTKTGIYREMIYGFDAKTCDRANGFIGKDGFCHILEPILSDNDIPILTLTKSKKKQ